jgi:5-methylcytosine-specific restriction endonuclease McrA
LVLRKRSKKRAKVYRDERVPIVVKLLIERPTCQRCKVSGSQDIHELKSRARGGSITDLNNLVALCRACHTWITANPAKATQEGWLRHSWD